MGQGALLRVIGRLRERRMHNQSPSQFTLATIGSACIFGLLTVAWTPARAAPKSVARKVRSPVCDAQRHTGGPSRKM